MGCRRRRPNRRLNRRYCPSRHGRVGLALIAARFVLPGPHRPDVDRAIDSACRLLAGNLETPATVEVACLGHGTPLRDAEPVLRQMLHEHGVPVTEPGASDAQRFRAAVRAFGVGAIGLGEFCAVVYQMLPPWNEQDNIQRSLNLLLLELDQATTSEDQDEIIQRIRWTALRSSQETQNPSRLAALIQLARRYRNPSPGRAHNAQLCVSHTIASQRSGRYLTAVRRAVIKAPGPSAITPSRTAGSRTVYSCIASAGRDRLSMPPTERSSAELTFARHLARAMEDLLTAHH